MNDRIRDPDEMRARELARLGGTTVRTVHYYVTEGLLPPPVGATRGAVYNRGHLQRLRLIAALRDEGLSLAAIRSRLSQLGDRGVADILRTLHTYEREARSGDVTVLGIVEAALVEQSGEGAEIQESPPDYPMMEPASAPEVAPPPGSAREYVDRMLRRSEPARSVPPRSEPPRRLPETWHYFTIEDGIELRIRDDRLRSRKRAIDTFIDAARDLARRSLRRRID